MANVENYGWAYVHPTASQAQARGVNKFIKGCETANTSETCFEVNKNSKFRSRGSAV